MKKNWENRTYVRQSNVGVFIHVRTHFYHYFEVLLLFPPLKWVVHAIVLRIRHIYSRPYFFPGNLQEQRMTSFWRSRSYIIFALKDKEERRERRTFLFFFLFFFFSLSLTSAVRSFVLSVPFSHLSALNLARTSLLPLSLLQAGTYIEGKERV